MRTEAEGGSPPQLRLRRRAEFVATSRGQRWNAAPFSLQIATRPAAHGEAVGIGFTVTRKIGGAVVRNRARRRLREAVRIAGETLAPIACNLVIVARPAALTCPFDSLVSELRKAFQAVPRKLGQPR